MQRPILGGSVLIVMGLGLNLFQPLFAQAQSLPRNYQLPLDLAAEAGMAAISACRKSGHQVAVTIVNSEGQKIFVARDDGAPIHTLENSFNKAYTIVTFGKVYKQTTTAELIELFQKMGRQPPSLPGIAFSPGGIAIKAGNEIIAGLGVSGAPGGPLDAACAQAGLDRIQKRLL